MCVLKVSEELDAPTFRLMEILAHNADTIKGDAEMVAALLESRGIPDVNDQEILHSALRNVAHAREAFLALWTRHLHNHDRGGE